MFSAPMVRAILTGMKTQTRRVVKGDKPGQPLDWLNAGFDPAYVASPENGLCPYGLPGDRLWVRETWSHTGEGVWTIADARRNAFDGKVVYRATDDGLPAGCWWPSIHMPREFSRITLRITDVRVERLQSISADDAFAEGVGETDFYDRAEHKVAGGAPWSPERLAFADLWQSINGTWDENPWVWVVAFERVTP